MFFHRFRQNITNLGMNPRFPDNKYAFVTCFYPIKEGQMKQSIDEYKTKISRLFIYNLFITINNLNKTFRIFREMNFVRRIKILADS